MKTSSAVIVIVVVVMVLGVAWFRSAREGSTAGTPTPTALPAAVNPIPSPTTPPATPGELCPEAPPTASTDQTPTSIPTPAKKTPRVVDLGADKCVPCKQLAPILEELKRDYAGRVAVEFIDVWKDPRAGEPYKIRVIPTQVFFDADGNEVWRHEGFLPKADFIAKFSEMGVR